MTIKQYGGVFGRNPTFNNVTIEGTLTFDGDIDINSDLTISGNLYLPDNSKAIFGNNDDLQIYHDGSHSYIKDTATGNLRIDGTDIQIRSATGANMAAFVSGAEVQLYHNNQKKLDTTTTGIDVTGSVTADGLTVDGGSVNNDSSAVAGKFNANGNEHIRLEISTDSTIGNQAGLDLISNSITSRFSTTGSGGLVTSVNGSNRMAIATNGDISFYEDTGTTPKFFWDASAEALGIGTSLPLSTMHLSTTGGGSIYLQDSDATATYNISELSNNAGNFGIQTRNSSGTFVSTDYQIVKNASGADYHRWFTQGTERLRLDASGNVRIGVGGSTAITGLTQTNLIVGSGTGGEIVAYRDDNAGVEGDFVGAFLFGNDDNSGAEDHFAGMYGKIVGTAGNSMSLNFASGLGNYENDTPQMVLDASGNLGIGTDSPDYPLHVKGTTNILKLETSTDGRTQLGGYDSSGNTNFLVGSTDSTNVELWNYKNGYVRFATNSTERMRIDASGNLQIAGTGVGNTSNTITFKNGAVAIAREDNNLRLHGFDNMIFGVSGTSYPASTERMRIDANGNLLVGTTDDAPGAANTNTGVAIRGGTDNRAFFSTGSTYTAAFNRNSDGQILNLYGSGSIIGSIGTIFDDLYIGTGDTNIRFDATNDAITPRGSGGSARPDAVDLGSPSVRFKDLHLSGTANVGALSANAGTGQISATFESTDSGSYINIIDSGSGTFGAMIGAVGDDMLFSPNNVEAMRIDASGNLLVSGTSLTEDNHWHTKDGICYSYRASGVGRVHNQFFNAGSLRGEITSSAGGATLFTSISDSRVKENITDAVDAGSTIDALQVRQFDMIGGAHHDYGMVAQELALVCPDSVYQPEDPEKMMSVDYSKLVPMMLKEIQSLRARVAQLES